MKYKLTLKEKRQLAELYAKQVDIPPQEMLEQMFYDDSRIMVCRNYFSDSPGYYGDIVWVIGGDSCYMTCFQKKTGGEWYIKYDMGLRCDDDYRQIRRWQDFCGKNGRWRKLIYRRIYEANDWQASPRIQQSLLHWGYRVNQEDYDLWCAMTNHKYKEIEWCHYGGLPSPSAYMNH